jgi:hypothetical protein
MADRDARSSRPSPGNGRFDRRGVAEAQRRARLPGEGIRHSSLTWPMLILAGVEFTPLLKETTDHLGVPVEGPYKLERYRC